MNQGGPVSRKTMAYSFVAPKGSAVAPTEPMEAVSVSEIKNISQPQTKKVEHGDVHKLVSLLIEKDIEAWRALPDQTRHWLLSGSWWEYTMNEKTALPNLIINQVELRWNGSEWVLHNILMIKQVTNS
jgi:hypothetical protein